MVKSDNELVMECLGGNPDAFGLLVTRYKRFVYGIVYKYFKNTDDVDDISQEVFLKLYKSLNRYNPEYKFSTWTARITVNLCLDILRKKKIDFVPLEEIEAVTKDSHTPETMYFEKERNDVLYAAIDKLPEKYKTVVLMYHQKGASYKEMAETLDQSMSIIKNRLHRARLMLRENLGSMEGACSPSI